jgi:hypothetical protein
MAISVTSGSVPLVTLSPLAPNCPCLADKNRRHGTATAHAAPRRLTLLLPKATAECPNATARSPQHPGSCSDPSCGGRQPLLDQPPPSAASAIRSRLARSLVRTRRAQTSPSIHGARTPHVGMPHRPAAPSAAGRPCWPTVAYRSPHPPPALSLLRPGSPAPPNLPRHTIQDTGINNSRIPAGYARSVSTNAIATSQAA